MKNRDFNLPEEQKAYVLSRAKTYNGVQSKIVERLSKDRSELTREYKETIRNFAIVSGALATFALVLLGSIKSSYLTWGVCLLLIVVIICFVHLMRIVDRNARAQITYKRDFLKPMQDMSKNCIDFIRGLKSFDEWLKDENQFLNRKYDEVSSQLGLLSNKEDRLNYTGDIITIIFTLAIILIIFSILS